MIKFRVTCMLIVTAMFLNLATITTKDTRIDSRVKPSLPLLTNIEAPKEVNIEEELTNIAILVNQEVELSIRKKACAAGKFKSYTNYRVYKKPSTKQYKLQVDKDTYTDEQGFRRYKHYYIVAVGSYYSRNVGDTFHVVMESGKEFDIIVGDVKQDRHTDDTNCYCLNNGSVLEFIVDTDMLSDKSRKMGNVSYSGFEGNISYIY